MSNEQVLTYQGTSYKFLQRREDTLHRGEKGILYVIEFWRLADIREFPSEEDMLLRREVRGTRDEARALLDEMMVELIQAGDKYRKNLWSGKQGVNVVVKQNQLPGKHQ